MKYGTYRFKDNQKYKKLKIKLLEDELSFQDFVSKCIEKYLNDELDPRD